MRKALYIVVFGCFVMLAVAAVVAAQGTAQPPKPDPEVQKLAYFAGSWKYEGEAKASEFGPAGKFSGTETCEWFAGGFQLVCRSEETGPRGKSTGMNVMAYDTEEKVHTYYGMSSRGENFYAKGTFAGATMNTTWEGKIGGKPVKIRGTMVQVSPTSCTFKMETSTAGGPWTLVGEGKETKVK